MAISDARIDYVSLRIPFDSLEKAAFVNQATEDIIKCADSIRAHLKCYRVRSYYDQGLKKHISTLDIWGPVAGVFFEAFANAYWPNISRLDYREPIIGKPINWDEFFRVTKARNKGRSRVDLIDSPLRNKDGKRPTGGTGLVIGAPDSARKLSYYQRAQEGPAFEFQFVGAEMRKWLSPILRDGAPEGRTMAMHVFLCLRDEAHRYATLKTGLSVADLEDGISVASADLDYTEPEQVLQQLDLLFDVLPTEAQEAFIEAHTTASPEAVSDAIERVRLTSADAWDEEPADLWDPYAQFDW